MRSANSHEELQAHALAAGAASFNAKAQKIRDRLRNRLREKSKQQKAQSRDNCEFCRDEGPFDQLVRKIRLKLKIIAQIVKVPVCDNTNLTHQSGSLEVCGKCAVLCRHLSVCAVELREACTRRGGARDGAFGRV